MLLDDVALNEFIDECQRELHEFGLELGLNVPCEIHASQLDDMVQELTKSRPPCMARTCAETKVRVCDHDYKRIRLNQDEGPKDDDIDVNDVDATAHHRGTLMNTTKNTDMMLPPNLVTETDVGATSKSTSLPVTSDSPKLGIPDKNNTSSYTFDSLTVLPPKQTGEVTVVPATIVKEAQKVAQSIRVTQAVFEQHGLDSSIAAEWAMRRQESKLSETSRQRYETRKVFVETVQRHEDRKVSERQFQDMKSTMEYDNDWLPKIHKARDKCLQACVQSLLLSVVVMIMAEIYFSLPPDTSPVAFISFLLGCECNSTDNAILAAPNGTSLAWFSGYFRVPFDVETPLCYARCIAWRLIPPFCIQVLLNFCKCPRLIHQGVTFLTIVSLLAPQLEDAVSIFAWYRVLPLIIVTLACVFGTWFRSSFYVTRLQKSSVNMRNELEGAFISMDSLRVGVLLVHVCVVGVLLARSLQLSLYTSTMPPAIEEVTVSSIDDTPSTEDFALPSTKDMIAKAIPLVCLQICLMILGAFIGNCLWEKIVVTIKHP